MAIRGSSPCRAEGGHRGPCSCAIAMKYSTTICSGSTVVFCLERSDAPDSPASVAIVDAGLTVPSHSRRSIDCLRYSMGSCGAMSCCTSSGVKSPTEISASCGKVIQPNHRAPARPPVDCRALAAHQDPLPVRGVAAQERVPARVAAAAGKGFASRCLRRFLGSAEKGPAPRAAVHDANVTAGPRPR